MNLTVMEWLVLLLLAAWFVVTVGYQLCFTRLAPVLARWDVFRIVPSWRLYTSLPTNLRLYYRDRDAAGNIGDWQALPNARSQRPWRALFNPELFAADARISFAEMLAERLRTALPPERVVTTVAWRALWQCVAMAASAPGTVARQFELREQLLTPADAPETRLHTSEFLPLVAGKETA